MQKCDTKGCRQLYLFAAAVIRDTFRGANRTVKEKDCDAFPDIKKHRFPSSRDAHHAWGKVNHIIVLACLH